MEAFTATCDGCVRALLALRRSCPGGSFPVPSRRVLLGIDIFLLVAIVWTAFAPVSSSSEIGPSTGYREPDVDARIAAQAAATKAVGHMPRPWMSNATARRGRRSRDDDDDDDGEGDARGRRMRRRKKKKKHGGKAHHASEHRKAGFADDGITPHVAAAELEDAEDDAGDVRDDLVPPALDGAPATVTGGRNASCVDALRAAPDGGACTDARTRGPPRRVVVTLSIGKRSHFSVTRVPMLAYARRANARLVVVDAFDHPALARWNATLKAGANSHFMKLPMLQHFLREYDQVLFLDDDVLLSPHAPDLFEQVPCDAIGAVVEGYHAPGWHAMHGRSYCELYGLETRFPGTCGSAEARRRIRIFNSGVMVLSKAHLPLLEGWESLTLQCRILCDQLYMNAKALEHGVCVHDLGNAFNLPGTQVRKQLATASKAVTAAAEPPSLAGSALADSCFIHLTVLPAKPYTSHYLLLRALAFRDILRCEHVGGRTHALTTLARRSMLTQLPEFTYDIQKIWCKGKASGCHVIPPRSEPSEGLAAPEYALIQAGSGVGSSAGASGSSGGGGGGNGVAGAGRCAAHAAAAALAEPPIAATVGNASEVPPSARRVLHRAAASSWDCNTVVLLFATKDFFDLAINWAQQAVAAGVNNFVLVAMDQPLADTLAAFDAPPGLLLPRVASRDVAITKLNVIGERQRFGLRVLESGFNVLFADLDALFLKSPAPLLADGDIIGERIWGRPMSLVKKWGAAICTGFYFVRSTPRTIAIFRKTHLRIALKRTKQPKWQASDQWAINHAVDDADVVWQTPMPMKGISDYGGKYTDTDPAVGFTKRHRSKFVVLPHVHVARSCPILKHGTAKPPEAERVEQKKWRLWQHLLQTAYTLHCFPPDSMPCPQQKHGEKGCDKSVIMGSAVHIHGEVVFDQRQGLWFMRSGWEEAIKRPSTRDFFAWLKSQHNGAKPGEAPPE